MSIGPRPVPSHWTHRPPSFSLSSLELISFLDSHSPSRRFWSFSSSFKNSLFSPGRLLLPSVLSVPSLPPSFPPSLPPSLPPTFFPSLPPPLSLVLRFFSRFFWWIHYRFLGLWTDFFCTGRRFCAGNAFDLEGSFHWNGSESGASGCRGRSFDQQQPTSSKTKTSRRRVASVE